LSPSPAHIHERPSFFYPFYIHVEIEYFKGNVVGGYVDFRITTYMAADGCVETEKKTEKKILWKPSPDRPGEPIGDDRFQFSIGAVRFSRQGGYLVFGIWFGVTVGLVSRSAAAGGGWHPTISHRPIIELRHPETLLVSFRPPAIRNNTSPQSAGSFACWCSRTWIGIRPEA